MTKSLFLVHLIDKDDYNGIMALLRLPHDLFTKGISRYVNGMVYMDGIEPEPERTFELLSGGSGMDSDSIWLGVEIIPEKTFEENITLFNNLCDWIMDFLYLVRFLINLNLKARVFFHVENYMEEEHNSTLSLQKLIELNCDSGSNFQVRFNQYQLVLPFLAKLLQYKPTDKLKAIMYNYATSKVGNSGVIDYFFCFATLEGIIHNWAEAEGYSHLWGSAIADSDEQENIHENLRSHFEHFIIDNNLAGDKLRQLNSFKDSTFPTDRKIMRSLYQRFKSYCNYRLPEELRGNEYIQTMLEKFRRIYPRRNEIGHSLETYTRTPGFVDDVNTLMSAMKLIMDYELSDFLNNEIDWKFENRVNNLEPSMRRMAQISVLDKFSYHILDQNQNDIHLKTRFGTSPIEKVEFHSEIAKQENSDLTTIVFSQNLKLILPLDFSLRDVIPESTIVNAYDNPYWWVTTTLENTHYIFKTFPPSKINTHSTRGVSEKFCEISSENILMVIKLDFIDIPDDLDIFS